ncbi:hypothetical protein [Actinomadura montaniterrae]|uniref:hypothetical protein n=1 Tax=Actinomadura montaniterrae TaxID=1803903 RepID=UPI00124CEBAD|nr:hypothetical protein [Actinomadura montaniterrae]
MISYDRFKFALTNLDGTQWRLFEVLANVFLSDEYSSLRPLASASGDDGMDAGLFRPEDDPQTVLQFSVRKDFANKVRETCERLKETQSDTNVLIYCSNQEIGAAANALRKKARQEYQIFLDVRDREWFLTQRNASAKVTAEAEEFCEKVADPQLFGDKTFEAQAQALTDLEAKAAFVHLGLQWADDTREKGLTKLCFEALVRSVLRDTTSESRIDRQEVRNRVARLLPAHHRPTLDAQVDAALARLAKVYIRHWQKLDEFCLTWDERVRLASRLAETNSLDEALKKALARSISITSEEMDLDLPKELEESLELARKILERILLERGEVFAEAVNRGQNSFVRFQDVEAVVYHEIATTKVPKGLEPRVLVSTVQSLLLDSSDEIRRYLRGLADTYTLFAFMRETPDVQSAVVKIFAEGDIWLDTSVVLPLLAETLVDPHARSHSYLLRAAVECGLRLFVTSGVIEEITTHIRRCLGFYRSVGRGTATGEPPFLLASYRLSGRDIGRFPNWLEHFAGSRRPEDDVADYLYEEHRIELRDLIAEADSADPDLRSAVSEIWHEAREERDHKRQLLGIPTMDPITRGKLVAHDVENYVGVVMRRTQRGERRSAFGYKSWWLTFDRQAFFMPAKLSERLGTRVPQSPAISPDFILHYLAVGPVRARLSRSTEESLPLMMNMTILDAVPRDLLELADDLRRELADLPPHVVSRKIRDTMDEARLLLGATANAGESGLTERVKQQLIAQARAR